LGQVSTLKTQVWYVAYGSNMHAERFGCYLRGGRPPGGARLHPGCRDTSEPERRVPVTLPGLMYFAEESAIWTGGVAFYDPTAAGETPARAYLVSEQQFSDVAAQEMHREPGTDLDLAAVLADGTARLGDGRYETLVCAGRLDGLPLLTFTAPWRIDRAALNPPSAAYLRHLAAGLAEAHGWPAERIDTYLSSRPGAQGPGTSAPPGLGGHIRGH
jgi:hypothetical protein